MKVEEVRNELISGIEGEYTSNDIKFIDKRLNEIASENGLSMEELNEYCWANSSEIFTCIFNGKEFNTNNFVMD